MGYADDLVSAACRKEGLQARADIVAAFCAIFGLEISVAKLRLFKVQWGGEQGRAESQAGAEEIVVHSLQNGRWTPTAVAIRDYTAEEAVKYLGVTVDLGEKDKTSYQQVGLMVERCLRSVQAHRFDRNLQIDAITCSIYAKVRYRGKLASWSLREYEELDRVVAASVRKILRLMPSMATELIYMVGLTRLTDLIQKDKIGVIVRSTYSGGRTQQAVDGIMERAARHRMVLDTDGREMNLSSGYGTQVSWADSLIDWLARPGLSLKRAGSEYGGGADESLIEYIRRKGRTAMTAEQKAEVWTAGIYTVADAIGVADDDTNHWADVLGLEWLQDVLPLVCPSGYLGGWRIGQCWGLSDDAGDLAVSRGQVVEFLGTDESSGELHVRAWTVEKLKKRRGDWAPRKGDVLKLKEWSHSQGAGTALRIDPSILVGYARKYVLSRDRNVADGVLRTVLFVDERKIDRTEPVYTDRGDLGMLINHVRDSSELFTDGSMTTRNLLPVGVKRAFSAAVVVPHDGAEVSRGASALRIVGGGMPGLESAYDMETTALATAMALFSFHSKTGVIHSDCKSAITVVDELDERRLGRAGAGSLGLLWQICAEGKPRVELRHVRAHPEKTKLEWSYSAEERGNVMADKVAGNGQVDDCSVLEMSVGDVLSNVWRAGTWWVTDANLMPQVASPLSLVREWRFQQYLRKRDEYPVIEGNVPRWADIDFSDVDYPYQPYSKLYTWRVRICKLVWDKSWHGGNRAKAARGEEAKALASQCVICGGVDSEYHMLVGCPHATLEEIRVKALLEVSKLITEVQGKNEQAYVAGATYRDMLSTGLKRHMAWKGVWTPEATQEYQDRVHSTYVGLRGEVFGRIALRLIGQIRRVMATACLDIQKQHAKLGSHGGPRGGNGLVGTGGYRGPRRSTWARDGIPRTEHNNRCARTSVVKAPGKKATRKSSYKRHGVGGSQPRIDRYLRKQQVTVRVDRSVTGDRETAEVAPSALVTVRTGRVGIPGSTLQSGDWSNCHVGNQRELQVVVDRSCRDRRDLFIVRLDDEYNIRVVTANWSSSVQTCSSSSSRGSSSSSSSSSSNSNSHCRTVESAPRMSESEGISRGMGLHRELRTLTREGYLLGESERWSARIATIRGYGDVIAMARATDSAVRTVVLRVGVG